MRCQVTGSTPLSQPAHGPVSGGRRRASRAATLGVPRLARGSMSSACHPVTPVAAQRAVAVPDAPAARPREAGWVAPISRVGSPRRRRGGVRVVNPSVRPAGDGRPAVNLVRMAPDRHDHGRRVARWETRSEIPMLGFALAFAVAYVWPVLDRRMEPGLAGFLHTVAWTVWVVFALDFVVRVALARRRVRYVVRHWYDVALVVLPLLRPLRVLRVLAFVRIINRSAVGGLIGRVGVYAAGTAALALGLGAVAVLDAERNAPGATITGIGDALWWACTTVTTVGYGDLYPVTTEGRLIAVALMFVGIALVGAVTASFAAWLVSAIEGERAAARVAEEGAGPLPSPSDPGTPSPSPPSSSGGRAAGPSG